MSSPNALLSCLILACLSYLEEDPSPFLFPTYKREVSRYHEITTPGYYLPHSISDMNTEHRKAFPARSMTSPHNAIQGPQWLFLHHSFHAGPIALLKVLFRYPPLQLIPTHISIGIIRRHSPHTVKSNQHITLNTYIVPRTSSIADSIDSLRPSPAPRTSCPPFVVRPGQTKTI